jgi:hypothetical protein
MLLVVGGLAILLKSGIPENLALTVAFVLASVKAAAAKLALGLARKAIQKKN